MRSAIAIAVFMAAGAVSALGAGARAEAPPTVRMIVNAQNPVSRLDRRFVSEAFLKKRTHWDDEHAIQPVDLGEKSAVRDRFSRDVLERDVPSVRRYWAQQVFSGHGVPPPEVTTDTEVVKYVASHPGGIGYVSGGGELAGVRVVELD